MKTFKYTFRKNGKTLKHKFIKSDCVENAELLALGTKNLLKADEVIVYEFNN